MQSACAALIHTLDATCVGPDEWLEGSQAGKSRRRRRRLPRWRQRATMPPVTISPHRGLSAYPAPRPRVRRRKPRISSDLGRTHSAIHWLDALDVRQVPLAEFRSIEDPDAP